MRWLALALVAGCWTGPEDSLPRPAPVPVPVAQASEPAPRSGDAKIVDKREHGGVIELYGDRERAMVHANELMAAHCGGEHTYTVVAEGEEAVAGGATAWRVHYQCG